MMTLIIGLGWTLATALCAGIIALVLGSASASCARRPSAGRCASATRYVEIFRNIPLLVQLFLWYFVLPEVLPDGVW